MVQVINTGGTLGSRIGAGIGQGLAEQLPKEIKNYRISKGIESLKEKGDLHPLEQIQHLLRSGASMEDIGALLPFIQQSQARGALKAQAQQKKTPGAQVEQKAQTPESIEIKEEYVPKGKGGFASEGQLADLRSTYKTEPSTQEIAEVASELMDAGFTQNVNEARQMAYQNIKRDIDSQQANLDKFKQISSDTLSKELQGFGLEGNDYKDITGQIQQKLINEGEFQIAGLKKTPQEVGAKIAKIGTELGKTALQAKKEGSISNLMTSSSDKVNRWKSLKSDYDKYGLGQQFDEIVSASSGLTPLQVAHELDPLKNKELESKIKSLKKPSAIKAFLKEGKLFEPSKLKEKDLNSLIMDIRPSDNINAIAYELRDRGFDVGQFLTKLTEMQDNEEISLTADQKQQKRVSGTNSILGDILFRIF